MTGDFTPARVAWLAFILLGVGLFALGLASTSASDKPEACDRTVKEDMRIQAAVDQASQGETICIQEGAYKEEITFRTDGLTLRATGEQAPVLDGENEFEVGIHAISVDEVRLHDLHIKNFLSNGIHLDETKDATVENITIIRESPAHLEGFVRDRVLENAGHGIHIEASSDAMVKNNTVRDMAGRDVFGIFLVHSQGNTLTNNTLRDNPTNGVALLFSDDNTVNNNTLESSWGGGIALYDSHRNNLQANTITKHFGGGMALFGSGENTINGNNFTNNRYDGLSLWFSDDNHIEENWVIKNVEANMVTTGSTGNTFSGNQFERPEPSITITSPQENEEFEPDQPVTIEGTVSPGDSPIDEVIVTVDGKKADRIRIDGNHEWATTWEGDVETWIEATVVDTENRTGQDRVWLDGGQTHGGDPPWAFGYVPTLDEPIPRLEVACEGLTCRFDASDSYSPRNRSLTYEWTLGDGDTATGETVNHTFLTAGTYNLTLQAQEDDGPSMTKRQQLLVAEGPTVTITSPSDNSQFEMGDRVLIEGRAMPGEEPIEKLTVTVAGPAKQRTLERVDLGEGGAWSLDWTAGDFPRDDDLTVTVQSPVAERFTVQAMVVDANGFTDQDAIRMTSWGGLETDPRERSENPIPFPQALLFLSLSMAARIGSNRRTGP